MHGPLHMKFPLRKEFTLDRFRVGLNQELIETAISDECVWIYGEARVGKTHVAQAVCRYREQSVFLPGKSVSPDDVNLNSYGAYRHMVIDYIDCWLGRREFEEQLFALIETRYVGGFGLLITCSGTPHQLSFSINDLGSRLRSFHCM